MNKIKILKTQLKRVADGEKKAIKGKFRNNDLILSALHSRKVEIMAEMEFITEFWE